MPATARPLAGAEADHRALGLGALFLYRFDTGYHLAPALEVEGGFTLHQYTSVTHVPAGAQFAVPLKNASETALYGAVTAVVEYRLGNSWVASTGFGVHTEPKGLAPWSLFVPFRVGRIW